jgi:hypothetical protein
VSAASSQYDHFKEEVVQDGKVFVFTKSGEYLVHPLPKREVIPCWSSRGRMEKIQALLPKYRAYEISELSVPEFLQWLPELDGEGIRIGTNWEGKRLEGYDVAVQDLQASLRHLLIRHS